MLRPVDTLTRECTPFTGLWWFRLDPDGDRWLRVVGLATGRGMPVPGFSSAPAYYDTVRRKWSGDRSEQQVR